MPTEALSREAYDALPHTNWSRLRKLARSPAHFLHSLTAPAEEDTDAMALGRAIHLAIFEPEVYRRTCVTWDGGVRRGKAWDAFLAAHVGREVLTEAQADTCRAVAAAVRGDAVAARYVTGGRAELAVTWQHVEEDFREDCKGRVDFVADCGAVVDVKTTRDASPEAFGKACWAYQYHAQAAFYVDGYHAATGQHLPFVAVAVETTAPHVVQVYRMPDAVLDAGREVYRRYLRRLVECRRTSRWPGYGAGELELVLPRWALTEDGVDGLDLKFG
jgi:hypothetical protein